MPAIRRSRRWCANARRRTRFWCRSIRSERKETPRSAIDILNRLNEISFNSWLMKELRMIALLREVADPGHSEGARWASMRIHAIATDMAAELSASSKLIAEWDFLLMLREEGRRRAEEFLERNGDALGKRSSFDLAAMLDYV